MTSKNTLNPLAAMIFGGTVALPAVAESFDEGVVFNDAFLPEDSRHLDLSRYEKGNPVLPGGYRADLALNGRLVGRRDIRIADGRDGGNAHVCFDRALLELLGVDLGKLPTEIGSDACQRLPDLIDGASVTFDPSQQRLDVSLPQASLRSNARGYVSPELWDRGVTAGILGYDFNGNRNRTDSGSFDSAYLGLSAGFNLGDWRLRHNGSLSWHQRNGRDYQSLDVYAQRDVTALKSQLTLGEANTRGELFDSQAYRGVQLASDDRMQPESRRGYAPVIRGIARTSARVSVRQNGNLLYETTVAPGAFVIDDLYPSGYGGDLDVTVHEADGSEQGFQVPYASVSQLLRPGTTRYSFVAGETRNHYIDEQANLFQGTVQRGLGNSLTGYGGVQGSDDYQAVMAGAAFGTPIGALAVDLTRSRAALSHGRQSGESLRLSYNKNILATGSNFALAAYRFSSEEYLGLDDALRIIDAQRRGLDDSLIGRPRSRLSLTANQSLGDYGQLALTGFSQNYWNLPGSDLQYQIGYSRQFGSITFGANANRTRMGSGSMQNSLLFSIGMPLAFGSQRPQLSARLARDARGDYSEQAALSGSAGEDRQYRYGLTVGHEGGNDALSTSLSGQYIGSSAIVGTTLSQGQGYRSQSLNLSGSAVVHPGGVTLTPYRGDTLAVLGAEGAAGARVVGYPGLALDGRGYAVLPYLRPYELNEVAIDPNGTPLDLELQETSQQVAPRAGAVVLLRYAALDGQALLLRATQEDGRPLPFGASVTDPSGATVGMMGQGSQLYARVKADTRRLEIAWGERPDQRCSLDLDSGAEADAVCRTSAPNLETDGDRLP
ncbi:fimbria/pilus outer membrane usher protein [Zestomonas carbonaria]|nr:fimbria/pilus outer membrane usher protein [Pseudomonas carbonaria]